VVHPERVAARREDLVAVDLYFFRHAKAVSRTAWDRDDSERPLAEQGREEAARMAGFVAKLGLAIDAIVSSPYARAYASAEIMAQHLNMHERLISDERVIPGFDLEELSDILSDYPDARALMFVGHEPDFSNIVARLVGGRVVFKKGGMAYVECPESSLKRATLVWLVQPSVLGV
jgi:phosphohistidine phosphatase